MSFTPRVVVEGLSEMSDEVANEIVAGVVGDKKRISLNATSTEGRALIKYTERSVLRRLEVEKQRYIERGGTIRRFDAEGNLIGVHRNTQAAGVDLNRGNHPKDLLR